MFVWLMLAQWIAEVAAAVWISPTTWIGVQQQIHQHVWLALLLGGILSSLPMYLGLRRPAATTTRHVIAASQMLHSALLIHLTGGRIETHFHIFGSLAFLAFYRDWRVVATATGVVAADHFIRGVFLPVSVFGSAGVWRWRWLEHAGWVVFEDIVLFAGCAQGVRGMRALAADRAALERSRDGVETQVRERTAELTETTESLRTREAEVRSARDQAEAASKAKSDFLANMSHEIRTPMGAILGYAELLTDAGQSVEQRADCVATIRRSGEHLLSLINDILDLSKIEAGRMTVEIIDCHPGQIAEEAVSLMAVRANAKGIALRLQIDSADAWVRSDPLRLRQVLFNLMGNAIKFTEKGEVVVTVTAEPSPTHAGRVAVRIAVRDSGIGIAPEHMRKLFGAFAQADASTTRKFGGTGLGLMISKRFAEMLDGDIEVRSQPGCGSTFTLALLCEPGAVPARAADENGSLGPIAAHAEPGDRLAGRILLAEDGPDNQRLLCFHLRTAGAEVEIAENGRLAVDKAAASLREGRAFALILMDMHMPELDGYGATDELRRKGWTGPIVALTAHAMGGDREKCLAAGCDEYLTKPIDRAGLIAMCGRFLAGEMRAKKAA